MNFQELLDYCTKLNNSTNEKCLVCHIPIENNEIHLKFVCSHYYHIDCIGYKSGKMQCMYCEKVSLPKIINIGNKNINNTIINDTIINDTIINDANVCKTIMKSGSRKGMECGRKNCKYHKNDIVVEEINCIHIIKTGIKKGQMCNRKMPWHFHAEKVLEV